MPAGAGCDLQAPLLLPPATLQPLVTALPGNLVDPAQLRHRPRAALILLHKHLRNWFTTLVALQAMRFWRPPVWEQSVNHEPGLFCQAMSPFYTVQDYLAWAKVATLPSPRGFLNYSAGNAATGSRFEASTVGAGSPGCRRSRAPTLAVKGRIELAFETLGNFGPRKRLSVASRRFISVPATEIAKSNAPPT